MFGIQAPAGGSALGRKVAFASLASLGANSSPELKAVLVDQPKDNLIDYLRELGRAVDQWLRSDVFRALADSATMYQRTKGLMWLPHHSMPEAVMRDLMSAHPDDTELSHQFGRFYSENWSAVKERFLESISSLGVDDEAKATLREALEAHGLGLYRCVPRLLFPELERVIGQLPHENVKRHQSYAIIESALAAYSLSDLSNAPTFGLLAFGKLGEHIYHQMWDDKPYPQAHTDPVPNRHGALHALVPYSFPHHSFNMLVMCEMIFMIVALVLKDRAEA